MENLRKLRENIIFRFEKNQDLSLQDCSICKSANLLEKGAKPLFHKRGSPNARIMFIGICPNYNDTFKEKELTVETSTDQTGKFFNKMRENLDELVIVTNSVLCLPRKDLEDKYSVTISQLEAYVDNLIKMITEIDPRIVITFGKAPWKATQLIKEHAMPFSVELTLIEWNSRILISTCHPNYLKKEEEKEAISQKILQLISSQLV